MVTVEDVAARLGIGRNQAYEAVRQGKIPAFRFGRRWLIPRAAFDRMLAGATA
jgi:excisionase family DNA binding protein